MEMLKAFFTTKAGKTALWIMLNSVMGLIVAVLTYYVSQNVAWAFTALPIATALSQFITKYLNTK